MEFTKIGPVAGGLIISGKIQNKLNIIDPRRFLEECFQIVDGVVSDRLNRFEAVKLDAVLHADYVFKKQGKGQVVKRWFQTGMRTHCLGEDFKEFYGERIFARILRQILDFDEGESAETMARIDHLRINICEFNFPESDSDSESRPII